MAEQNTTTGRRAAAGGRGGCLALLFFCVLGAAVVCWGRTAAAQPTRPDIPLMEFFYEVLNKDYAGQERSHLTAVEQDAFKKYLKRKSKFDGMVAAASGLGGGAVGLGLMASWLKDHQVTHDARAHLAGDNANEAAKERTTAKKFSWGFKGSIALGALALAGAAVFGFLARDARKKVKQVRHDYRVIRDNLADESSSTATQLEPVVVDSGADGGEEEPAEEEKGGASSIRSSGSSSA